MRYFWVLGFLICSSPAIACYHEGDLVLSKDGELLEIMIATCAKGQYVAKGEMGDVFAVAAVDVKGYFDANMPGGPDTE